jgi:hypothetical protein
MAEWDDGWRLKVSVGSVYSPGGTDVALADGGTGASTAQGAAANLLVPYVLAQSGVQVTNTGSTTENTLATITIPAGAMGANGSIRLITVWSRGALTIANNIQVRARYSGAASTVFGTYTMSTVQFSVKGQIDFCNRNSASSQIGGPVGATGGWSTTTTAVVTAAVDTTAATTILLTCQNTDAADVGALEFYRCELMYKA